MLSQAPVIGNSGAELVHVAAVSANFFPVLGIRPILGRQFGSEEENSDRGNVILLSEGLWRERFGADPGVLNQSIRLGERSFTVVGVAGHEHCRHGRADNAISAESRGAV